MGFTRDGDGSTLSLDFTQGILDSRISFSRSTTATFISVGNLTDPTLTIESVGGSVVGDWDDPNIWDIAKSPRDGQVLVTILVGDTVTFNDYNTGVLLSTASVNEPRFDHDPTTLAPRGLLIEGSATNLLNFSESFATSGGTNNNWGDTNITRTSTIKTDPKGGTTALRITASAGNGTIISSAAIGTSAERTFSVWLRRVTGTGDIQYTQNNGTNYTTQAITSSWVRYTFTHTANHQVGIRIVTSGDAIELWGAQLEASSGASSYIPTVASQVTRNADSAVMNDIASLNYSATNGTIYWSGIINKQPTSFSTLIGFMTAIDQPAYETFGNALNYFTAARGPSLNTGGANEVARPYVLGSLIKYASSVNTLVNPIVAVNLNGSAGSVNKSGTGDMHVATRLVLGRQPSSTYGANYPSVTIRGIKYWPTTKTAAELAVLTA